LPDDTPFRLIGILGAGVVGSALQAYLEEQGVAPVVYDPGLGLGRAEDIDEADLVFVCVPTPYHLDSGFDAAILNSAVAGLRGAKTVVIKSTVLPGTTNRLQDEHPQHRLLFNPEFLRERSAVSDFRDPDRQIVGFARECDRATAAAVLQMLPSAPYEAVVPARAAEMIKYACNSFLALKVTFANEMYDLANAIGVDYEDVRGGLAGDPRIGSSHLDVDDRGYRGYGGKCLPKDTMALLDFAREAGVPQQVLEAAHSVNLSLRGEAICNDLAEGGSLRGPADRAA
jgi:UDPglucose 6-dehydrogenase